MPSCLQMRVACWAVKKGLYLRALSSWRLVHGAKGVVRATKRRRNGFFLRQAQDRLIHDKRRTVKQSPPILHSALKKTGSCASSRRLTVARHHHGVENRAWEPCCPVDRALLCQAPHPHTRPSSCVTFILRGAHQRMISPFAIRHSPCPLSSSAASST